MTGVMTGVMTREVKSRMKTYVHVNDVVMLNAILMRLVMLRMRNVSNVKRLAIMEKFVPRTEAVRLLQVPSEVDAFEFQVLMTALQLRRGDRVCEPIAFRGWMLSLQNMPEFEVGCDPLKHTTVKGGHLITIPSHGWPPHSQQQVPKTSIVRSADLGQTYGTRIYVTSLDLSSLMAATSFQV